jgi:CheY-like chemotaxis protein
MTKSADTWTGSQETQESDLAFDGTSIQVLIAEDNEINQKVLKSLLEKEGLVADVVMNGFEVLEAFNYKAYDLIFMDIQMPVMDGIEAAQRLRQTLSPENQPKIIAVTSNAFLLPHARAASIRPLMTYWGSPVKKEAQQKLRFPDMRFIEIRRIKPVASACYPSGIKRNPVFLVR